MKRQTHYVFHKAFSLLNRIELPQVQFVRAVAIENDNLGDARFWEFSSLSSSTSSPDALNQNTFEAQEGLRKLTKDGQIVCLLDGRFPDGVNLFQRLQESLHRPLSSTSLLQALQDFAAIIREWASEQAFINQERDNANGIIAILQSETVYVLHFGKAQASISTNRIRARNILTGSAIQGFLQDRIKSYLQKNTTTFPNANYAQFQDWSWETGGERFVCRVRQYNLQGASRLVLLASDIWLPRDIETLLSAAKDDYGTSIRGAKALVQAFGRIDERPRGTCAVVDVLPQGVDTPDTDDIADVVFRTTKALKGVKSTSFLGISLGKVSLLLTLLVGLGYGILQWWSANKEERGSEATIPVESKQSRADSLRQIRRQSQDSTTEHNDRFLASDSLNVINSSSNKAILAFENVPKTVVPVVLRTQTPINSSNLASRVNVEFRGKQTVKKYRVELDTVKRILPPKTTRLNIIIEEPLSKGSLQVKVTYKGEETTSATVDVEMISKQEFAQALIDNVQTDSVRKPLIEAAKKEISKKENISIPQFLDNPVYGKKILISNQTLATLYRQSEVMFNASLAGVIEEMSVCYRFISFAKDSSAIERIRFEETLQRGIRRGSRISANAEYVEKWLEFRFTDGSRLTWAKSKRSIEQASPVVFLEKSDVQWSYKTRTSGERKVRYYPNDIEVTVPYGSVDVEGVSIDADTLSDSPVYASWNDVRMPNKPSIDKPRQTNLEKIIRSIKQSLEYSDASALINIGMTIQQTTPLGLGLGATETYLLIFDANNDHVELEKEPDFVRITPLSATFQKGRYSCKFLLSNLPPKPKNEEWVIAGVIRINTGAAIINPINRVVAQPDIDTFFQVPILIRYK